MAAISPRELFAGVFLLVLSERLLELWLSARNRRWALARGGVVVQEDAYGRMILLHSLFTLAAPLEVAFLPGVATPLLSWSMTALILVSMILRYWAIMSLGRRWNTQVICIPGVPAVLAGPYRWIRHPNYIAVGLEFFALPLIGGAWRTALIFGSLNLLVLRRRIRVEEAALSTHADYQRLFSNQPRFIPGGRGSSR